MTNPDAIPPPQPPAATPTAEVLRLLFERAPEIITLIDRQGRQLIVNSAAQKLLGIDPPGRLPLDGKTFVHPDDLDRLEAHREALDARTSAAEPVQALRIRVRAEWGEWRWLEMVFADMSDVPEIGGRVAFSRDVTQAEQRAQALLESQARLQALIANLPGAMIESAEGEVLLVNQHLPARFGSATTAEDLVGRSSTAVLEELSRSVVEAEALLRAVRQPSNDKDDFGLEMRSGRWLDVEVVPIRSNGSDFGRLWLFHDATARRQAELHQQHVLSLEQQARRGAELEADRLQAYDLLRNEFVARVSHELRTPLTSIASASELLLSDSRELSPEARQHLGIIQRNADRLRAMVEDLLLVGRLDAGMLTLELQPVSFPAIVLEAVEHAQDAARPRNVSIRVEGPRDGTIVADGRRLTEVIENLLGNAVKFTDPGTEVVIRIDQRDNEWWVTVRDHGPGIPPELRDAVFDRFVRAADADSSGTPGSGLGLAIVKGIVALHGGTVSVTDAPGGGAIFECLLPVGKPGASVGDNPPVETPDGRRGT